MTTDPVAAAFARPDPIPSEADARTIARNAAAARRFVERALGAGDMAAFDEIVADDVWVSSGLKPAAPITSKAEYGAILAATLGTALSNGEMTIHEVSPTLDGAILVRFTAKADHTGALDGIAATSRRLTLSEMHLMRFDARGRLVSNYVGALNPLQWEMIYAPTITPQILV